MVMMENNTENAEEFIPRNYQVQLMQIARRENTIIYLPTGSGKTYIAVMVLKQMGGDLEKPYSEGGKISIILVNTVALVNQHSEYIKRHTPFGVGSYSGEKGVDFYPREKWSKEFDTYQVFIMTSQILLNLINSNYVDMNKINLIVFDECHRGVNDHSMRNIMKTFENVNDPPRIIGLTATLLNGNCKPSRVMEEVSALETTFHSKVATVDELQHVIGFSTNPNENTKVVKDHVLSSVETDMINYLTELVNLLNIKLDSPKKSFLEDQNIKPLDADKGLAEIKNLIQDAIVHIQMLGIYGGNLSIIAHMIQIERMKICTQDRKLSNILNTVLTNLMFVKRTFENTMKNVNDKEKIYKFSSDKVKVLIRVLEEFKSRSKLELSAIIFVQRKFTAKILNFILQNLSKYDENFSYIKSNFIVGFNTKPFSETLEGLYNVKQNLKVLEKFSSRELNVLVASNVLEEGVDMPRCSLVVRFDYPKDYRSYVQSKGRARHKSSFFYILVEQSNWSNFQSKYIIFQEVETILNNYLIGQNDIRSQPSQDSIQKMYDEYEIEPYFVDGPGSAQINLLSAISLLCQYCSSLPGDKYTVYSPEWYRENSKTRDEVRVIIVLPTICPLRQPVKGPFVPHIKLAKRAAAFYTCVQLHKLGELDNNLIPKQTCVVDDNLNYLFDHWPLEKEREAGTKKQRRIYSKQITTFTQGQVLPGKKLYLHVIELSPKFGINNLNVADSVLNDLYNSSLCYGILTANPLPKMCKFPLYVSLGEISINVKVNQKELFLTNEQVLEARGFHHLIFNDVLKILREFLTFNNSENAETLLVVPVCKLALDIDFETIQKNKSIKKSNAELSHEGKLKLVVEKENYFGKIVAPWYRPDETHYVVVDVCKNLNSSSKFPTEDYESYSDYFSEKYNLTSVNPSQPLILVKALSKRLNCIKPRSTHGKRKRDIIHDEVEAIHLIAEFCVKQDFPACLWLQASLLPSILHRIVYLLNAEALRRNILIQTNLGAIFLSTGEMWKSLELDEHLLNYKIEVEKERKTEKRIIDQASSDVLELEDMLSNQTLTKVNQDYSVKILENRFPWKDVQEPKDIDRDLNVNSSEIYIYQQFISRNKDKPLAKINTSMDQKKSLLALTFNKTYEYKSVSLLEARNNQRGPELSDIYAALATAKAHDVVNLERVETLGDSFLKFISSLYIVFKNPTYTEGKATTVKNKLISNKNLYYLANRKNIPGMIIASEFAPNSEWLPPCFSVPDIIRNRINNNDLSITSLFNFYIPADEQKTGVLSAETEKIILEDDYISDENESRNVSLCSYLNQVEISDKTVADVVEALLGVYFQSNGFEGGIKFIEWIGIIPASEHLKNLIETTVFNPLLDSNATINNVDFHISTWRMLEKTLGYHFNNRAYLLQALTHPSYTPNRLTNSYEILEFIGDAILDFLITSYIFESCGKLDPGELTDLRSALVNNNTFASYTVRCGFHKYLLFINRQLEESIDKFVQFQENRNHIVDDEVLFLLDDDDVHIAEHVDVPKVLGDLFEALVGAVYLDCGKNLQTVWRVFHKIMWNELDLFSAKVPKNVVRLLYETHRAHPVFHKSKEIPGGKTMMKLEFMLNGARKFVHGFGDNKIGAKRAAAKFALRVLKAG